MRRKHADELLLMKMYFEHFDPIGGFRIERWSSQVENRSAMEYDELS
jgi:hypothetical protein